MASDKCEQAEWTGKIRILAKALFMHQSWTILPSNTFQILNVYIRNGLIDSQP